MLTGFNIVESEADSCNALAWLIPKTNSDNAVEVTHKPFRTGRKAKRDANIVVPFVIVFCAERDR